MMHERQHICGDAVHADVGGSDAPEAALAKAALALAGAADRLEKAIDEHGRLRAAVELVSPQLVDLTKRVAELEAQPRPARAATRAVPRQRDGGEEDAFSGVDAAIKTLSALPERERTIALMKVSLANPREMRV